MSEGCGFRIVSVSPIIKLRFSVKLALEFLMEPPSPSCLFPMLEASISVVLTLAKKDPSVQKVKLPYSHIINLTLITELAAIALFS